MLIFQRIHATSTTTSHGVVFYLVMFGVLDIFSGTLLLSVLSALAMSFLMNMSIMGTPYHPHSHHFSLDLQPSLILPMYHYHQWEQVHPRTQTPLAPLHSCQWELLLVSHHC
jgi:hypothetical protein